MKSYNTFINEDKRIRNFHREKEKFDAMPNSQKKDMYDMEVFKKKIEELYPEEKLTLTNYYDTKAQVLKLMDDSRLLNKWQIGNSGWDDGVDKDFAKDLKKMGLEFHWGNDEGTYSHNHIVIKPNDSEYRNWMWYYGVDLDPPKPRKKSVDDDKLIEESIEEFKKRGYDVKEATEQVGDRVALEAEFEGMNFIFEIMKPSKFFPSRGDVSKQVDDEIDKLEQSLVRHFKKIKEVWNYCEKIAEGPLWTMCGGGLQLQQFYGDDNGYLCTLYLDMRNEDENEEDYAKERLDDTEFTLTVNGSKNDPKFKDFKSDTGVKLITHKEIWGDKY